jgi:hypothetical protein
MSVYERTPMSIAESAWVPDVCVLPTAEQPLRQAEFDELFRGAVRSVDRIDNRRAIFELAPEPSVAARVADLAVRESDCCSFFTFGLIATGGRLTLDIAVPAAYVAVLDALVRLAAGGGQRG